MTPTLAPCRPARLPRRPHRGLRGSRQGPGPGAERHRRSSPASRPVLLQHRPPARARARRALGEEALPVIRLHDLRHTHATLRLADGVPVKVVSDRLGHVSTTVTLTVYQHVHPGVGSRGCRPLRRTARRLTRAARPGCRSIKVVSRGPPRPRHGSAPGS
ncbi:tyrosine-type recombinase/integrase [Geodermatophilus sp. SYSU D00703]